jgi:para-aminobenzoate synthetase
VRIVLIDNHDSFTFNLAHLIHQVTGEMPAVVANDATDWAGIAALAPDAIVLSPGPGHPAVPGDIGVCADAIVHATVPILGVCLGHQALALAAGARVVRAPEPRHGRISPIVHLGTDLFDGIPDAFGAVRYHSLIAVDLPPEIEPMAWTRDGLLMALRHRDRPWRGVQFHPESIATEHGARMIANFLSATNVRSRSAGPIAAAPARTHAVRHRVAFRRVRVDVAAEDAFAALFGEADAAFWLDSSRSEPGRARFSFMGDASGPRAVVATYDVAGRTLATTSREGGETRVGDCLDLLREVIDAHRTAPADLPFRFALGWVGCLGYELKAQTGGEAAHVSDTPDAAFIFADRAIAFDHETGDVWLLALVAGSAPCPVAEEWFDATEARLRDCPRAMPVTVPPLDDVASVPGRFRLDEAAYLDAIAACREALLDGQSYELCLTNRVTCPGPIDALAVYRALRRLSPAPYAAFLRVGDLHVLSASPECFLAIDASGQVETRPIKGTRGRGADATADAALARELASAEKDRAENLMIVDLLRNDLGRVARPGSVEAQRLFEVETFAQVHQLVSTIRARLAPGRDAFDCVRACFPGGSMTGAPKERTMRILDRLERGPRGLYSGALGYFSTDGAADLSIVIRSIVATPSAAHYGVGGAIVALSDPVEEWRETLVKGRALAAVLHAAARPQRLADAEVTS